MTRTVVVIDDDPDTLEFLEVLLSAVGMHVVACDHFCDPVTVIRQARPDMVLLDLQTPYDREAGLGLLEQLRTEPITEAIPVVVLTADHLALTLHRPRIRALGALALAKPFEPERLFHVIDQAMA